MKKKTIIIVSLIVLLPAAILTGGYFAYTKLKTKKEGNLAGDFMPEDETSSNKKDTTKSTINTSFPLKKNESVKSDLVVKIQKLLNEWLAQSLNPPKYNGTAIHKLEEDGYYGPRTAAVVRYYYPETDGNTITEQMYKELS